MTYYLTADLTFDHRGEDATDEGFDDFADRVIDELDILQEIDPGIIDPNVAGSLTQRSLSITMGIEAGNFEDAKRLFAINVRAALHAAECITAAWPRFVPTNDRPQVRRVDTAAA